MPHPAHRIEQSVKNKNDRSERKWRRQMSAALKDPSLAGQTTHGDDDAHALFATRVPAGFAELIDFSDSQDPLLKQILPSTEETISQPNFVADPVGDLAAMTVPGVLHKYHGRVLLVATGACAINCRYCFRRHFPYNTAGAAVNNWGAAVDYIGSDSTITEVILSGGDPLTLSTAKLRQLTDQLVKLPHINCLRIHSRIPTVMPDRINAELLAWLTELPLSKVLVTHVNHPRELANCGAALAALRDSGTLLLNQSVLLSGVNDDTDTLIELSQTLFKESVLPYYLHLLDPVAGAAHFEVSAAKASKLLAGLRNRLPGYLVPKLVRETPGASSKLPADGGLG